jgi:hypothetical protein
VARRAFEFGFGESRVPILQREDVHVSHRA